jgi:hypothetical protein
LTNGSFELDANGKVFSNGASSSTWRWFAVGDTSGSATIRNAATSQGAVGLELVRNEAGTAGLADTAIDKYLDFEKVPAEPRIYQLLLDARDGGVYGASDSVMMQLQFPAPTFSPWMAFDPGVAFETFGIQGISGSGGTVGARAAEQQVNGSVYLDNFRVYDVTHTNRVINGGFENSATRLLNWRAFSTVANELLASLSSDAQSGAQALRIERTATTGDAGVDTFDNKIPVFPGERIQYSLLAKKVSGDANTRLNVIVAEYNTTGTWTGAQSVDFYNPGATYAKCTNQLTLGPNTVSISIAFRLGDNANAVSHVGAYLIDNVDLRRVDNLFNNYGFESQQNGDLNNTINQWRVPFIDTAGTVTVRTSAASEGQFGVELTHLSGNFWLDRWLVPTTPVSKPGIYKLLVDAKNGGLFGSQDSFVFEAVMHAAPWPEFAITCNPSAAFETFGLTAPLTADRSGIDARLTPSGTANQSFFADNIQLIDVTRANRMVNGGFENSASRLVNWRHYSLNAGEFLGALVADAHSGARALRIERTFAGTGDADAAVDLYGDRIACLPGEPIEVSLWAKKVSGDDAARLSLILTEYDASTGVLIDTLTISLLNPGTSYQHFSVPVTMSTTSATLNVALAVLDDTTARHTGAYVIDDVVVVRNRAPSFSSAVLSTNSDSSAYLVAASGWSDADNDAEQYLYQWLLDGSPIAGATRAALAQNEIPGAGTVTCNVTAYDGISTGNTIEATMPPSLATVIEAGQSDTITVDGNFADWTGVSSRVLPMSVYGQGGEDMLVNIQFAWNSTRLYFLIREAQDDNQGEAANLAAFRAEPWMFDAISFWISFINGPTLLNSEFNPWYGFSSTNRTDLYSARLNNQATFDETAFAHADTVTSGTFANHNRVIEASVTWADLAAVLAPNYQPYGGLQAAIRSGFVFGCEPLLIDNGFPGQSFRTGQTHVYPSGTDYDSIDVKLVPAGYSINAAQLWNIYQ